MTTVAKWYFWASQHSLIMSSFVAVCLICVLSIICASWRLVSSTIFFGWLLLFCCVVVGLVSKVYRCRVWGFVFRQNR